VIATYLSSDLTRHHDVRVIATTHPEKRWLTPFVFAAALLRIRRLASAYGNRALFHIHTASDGSFARKRLALAFARRGGARTLLHLHGAEFERFYLAATAVRKARITRSFADADGVIALSSQWREVVERIAPGRAVAVLNNPVLIPAPRSLPGSGGLFVGRLSQRKGVLDLVEAIRLLQRSGAHERWVLAGDPGAEDV